MERFRFVIITGMSGAGKTNFMQKLEDMGYYCVDTCRGPDCPFCGPLLEEYVQYPPCGGGFRYPGRFFFLTHFPRRWMN